MLKIKIRYSLNQLDDDGKLKKHYYNKKHSSTYVGIPCRLSFDDYRKLMIDAGIRSSDLGYKGNNYVLARYNDTGAYEVGNCRFITQSENIAERKVTEKTINAGKANIRKAIEQYKNMTPEERSECVKAGIQKSKKFQDRHKQAIENERLRKSKLDKRHSGKHNSHYGSYWIHNGIENKLWYDKYGPIPKGYQRGRLCNYCKTEG